MVTSNFKKSAISYAEQGFNVLPLKPYGKEPATKHGLYDATNDVSQIESWWNENPNYNIGISTGDGFAVIDLDVNHGRSENNGIAELENIKLTMVNFQRQQSALPLVVASICIMWYHRGRRTASISCLVSTFVVLSIMWLPRQVLPKTVSIAGKEDQSSMVWLRLMRSSMGS